MQMKTATRNLLVIVLGLSIFGALTTMNGSDATFGSGSDNITTPLFINGSQLNGLH